MEFLDGLNTPTFAFGDFDAIGIIFKLLLFVILAMYVLYAFLLTLRVRILSDTVEVGPNKFVQLGIYIHMIVALVGSFLAFIITLLA